MLVPWVLRSDLPVFWEPGPRKTSPISIRSIRRLLPVPRRRPQPRAGPQVLTAAADTFAGLFDVQSGPLALKVVSVPSP